jgi:hypothetical protein
MSEVQLNTIESLDRQPFKHMVATIGNLPTSFVDSMSYYELLAWLCQYLEKTVIPAIDNNAEALEELQAKYIELKAYVDDYFENLDVQEEINNKLDDMAEAGTLEEIIGQYIHSSALLGFDTVSAMKTADNLINGSFAQTYGYNAKNDGGACKYKIRTITNDDVIDEVKIIELADDTLVAEMIEPEVVTPEMCGCYGDGTTDDTVNFQKMLDKFLNIHLLANKDYRISDTLNFRSGTKITGMGIKSCVSSYINTGIPIFSNQDTGFIKFLFDGFYIKAHERDAIGFSILRPYDSCIIRNMLADGFKNTFIKIGSNSAISQTLLLDNNLVYTESGVSAPIVDLTKCYEANITNNKFIYPSNNGGSAACLKLTNSYDANIQGNSFAGSSRCGIEITGTECRQNRIISNTYENISGDYSIILNGTQNDAIQYTLIIEAYTYYSAPNKVSCTNTAYGTIIGMQSTGGRRNLAINVNDPNVTDPYGNLTITSQSGALMTRAFNLQSYNGTPGWVIKSNDSANADYGILFQKTGHRNWGMQSKTIYIEGAGGKIRLTSPDGTKTRYIGVSNSGNVYTSEWEDA